MPFGHGRRPWIRCRRGNQLMGDEAKRVLAPLASALAAALLLAPLTARAQGQYEPDLSQADLETLLNTPVDVWTATKSAQKSDEAPAIVTVVTRDQFAVWGHRSVAELLAHLLGFYVIDDHTMPNLAVRGISGGLYSDASVIKVLIDGHAVAFASTGGNALGPELIPLSAVERVEIIRGPVSSLYGADAFLGVVNIQTRDGESVNGAVGSVTGGWVGEHPATDVDVSLGAGGELVDVMVAFRQTRQDLSGLELPSSSPAPAIPVYNLGERTARGLDQASSTAIATVTVRPRPRTQLRLYGYWSQMNRASEFGSLFQLAHGFSEAGVFSENRVSQWQVRSGLLWDQQVTDRLSLSLRGSYFQGRSGGDNRLEVDNEFYYVRRRFGFRGGDLDGNLVWTPGARLVLVGGAGAQLDRERLPSRLGIAKQQINASAPGDVLESISERGGLKTLANAGAYLHGTWDVLEQYLGLTAGMRYDHHNVYGGQLSRRIGVVSSPRPALHLKLLHGSAFKAPSPLLLYAQPSASGDVIGNPDLAPQYADTFELQLVFAPAPWLNVTTGVAYNLLHDKTEFIQQGINKVARNVARATTVSWESLVETRYPQWLHAHVSLELQHTTQSFGDEGYLGTALGRRGGGYPAAMVHGGVVVQPPRFPARAAVLASFIGRRWATSNNALLNGGPYRLPGYVLLDATLSTIGFHVLRDSAQQVWFSLSGKNLLGTAGPVPGFSGVDYPLSPRAFFLQLNLDL
jgi:outer membrane receptor for ferrienterochelin and colicins